MQFSSVRKSLSTVALILSVTSGASIANVQIIGGNFGPFDPSSTLLPTDVAGVVPGANWNNLGGASGTNVALQDSNAALTTATVTYSATSAFEGGEAVNTASTGTNKMYVGTLIGNNVYGEVNVTISNIPYSLYDVYVYDTVGSGHTLSLTDGFQTFYYSGDASGPPQPTTLTQVTSTDPSNPTVANGTYTEFAGNSSSTFTFATGGSIDGVISNNVYGFEIANAAGAGTPEPGSYALLGGLGISVLALRRRLRSR